MEMPILAHHYEINPLQNKLTELGHYESAVLVTCCGVQVVPGTVRAMSAPGTKGEADRNLVSHDPARGANDTLQWWPSGKLKASAPKTWSLIKTK
ncbi:uncharacterized protein SPSK_05735 [Sporothrix schenckii 1099-18]|uniref:Uncharacterized protein n=1 Tax=Sporothrix schenckii 1099-18 TaxID=1397361 RepID=A0A0F2LVI0_SPOSC|nr:uncharacterized protein SPSK_05735 [Sporothrix schenckii 1099-18]KJR80495.1 hypothetical protein SPSK_05735 [Sporothrix schenckii 1099-18]